MTFAIEGRPVPTTEGEKQALTSAYSFVTPGYFATMRIPVLRGRDFSETDTLSSPWVAVINETMARVFGPMRTPWKAADPRLGEGRNAA
jgi:hypothetical protein